MQVVGLKCLVHSRRLGLPPAFHLNASCVVLTALASAMFHATLLLRWQRLDETFENMILVFMLRGSEASLWPALLHAAAATAGIIFFSFFLFCELHLVGMAIANIFQLRRLCLPMRAVTLTQQRLHIFVHPSPTTSDHFPQGNTPQSFSLFSACLKRASLTVIAAAACWLLDRVACLHLQALPVNPQLHAAWHVLCAAALGDAFACAATAHVCLHGKKPQDSAQQSRSQALLRRWGWFFYTADVVKCT